MRKKGTQIISTISSLFLPHLRHSRRFALAYAMALVTTLPMGFTGSAQGGDTPIMVSYGEKRARTPLYRTWNGLDWAGELSVSPAGDRAYWLVLKGHPTKAEAVLGCLDDDGCLWVQVWDGDSWGEALLLTAAIGPGNAKYRGFDIAYEQSSGSALIVYSTGSTDPEYRVWDGFSWSDPDTVDLPAGGTLRWVRLVPKPASETMILVTLDRSRGVASAVWDGSQFGNSIDLESRASFAQFEAIDAGWEGQTGQALVVWGWRNNQAGYIKYNIWDGNKWGLSAFGPSLTNDCFPRYLRLAPKPASDTILLAVSYDDQSSDPPGFCLKANLWNGSHWGGYTTIEPSGMEDGSRRCFDIVFESSGDQAILGWSDEDVHTLDFRTWRASTGWSAELTGPNLGNDIELVQLRADPYSDEVMLGTITNDSHLQLTLWSGSVWETPREVETLTASQKYEPYMIGYRPGAVTWAWIYPTSGSIGGIGSSPTIRGGRVYVGSDDARLYCLDALDGSLIWTYRVGDVVRSSPSATYESGNWVIYFGANDGNVHAVKDAGPSYEVKWTRDLGAVVGSSPALWDSLLYIGCEDDSLHCLRMSDGTQKWATYLHGDISSSPAVFDDVVYIGSKSDTLYALNRLDGTVLRRYGICGDLLAPVFITWETGRVCIGSYASPAPGSDTMYVIDSSNFSTYWKFADSGNLAGIYTAAFCLPGTNNLYFGSDNSCLYCLNLSDSTLVYTYDTGEAVRSSPLYWNGVVYFGSNNRGFYGLDDSAQRPLERWPFITNDGVQSSPAISVSLNMAIVGSSDGHIYGFNLE